MWKQATGWTRWIGLLALAGALRAQVPLPGLPAPPPPEIRQGRELLAKQQYAEAKKVFATYLHVHAKDVQAELGVGDAQLGLHEYEAAERTYRTVAMQQPELWLAHKNLVVVEAALGRWEDFDRERMVLRMARQRGAPGISTRESDVIDRFTENGAQWVVRAYFEPVGRAEARYNFEHFRSDGRVQAYLSLENAAAAQAALLPGDERVGVTASASPANSESQALTLNWYTGSAHGTVRTYTSGEPPYPALRAEVQHWLRMHPEVAGVASENGTNAGAAARKK